MRKIATFKIAISPYQKKKKLAYICEEHLNEEGKETLSYIMKDGSRSSICGDRGHFSSSSHAKKFLAHHITTIKEDAPNTTNDQFC